MRELTVPAPTAITQAYPSPLGKLETPQISLRDANTRKPEGAGPTGIEAIVFSATKSTTDTVPSPALATYAYSRAPGFKIGGRYSRVICQPAMTASTPMRLSSRRYLFRFIS